MMKYVKPLELFRELLNSKALGKRRLLGLDVGEKYVGLAVSDKHNKLSCPLSVLLRKKSNIGLMATDFQSLISELSLAGFVVGCPMDRRRSTPDALLVKLFVDELCKTGKLEGVKYTYWNECYTSKFNAFNMRNSRYAGPAQVFILLADEFKSVELLLKPFNVHPVEEKTMLDKFAAVGILQGYLDFVNKKVKEEVNVCGAEKEDCTDI